MTDDHPLPLFLSFFPVNSRKEWWDDEDGDEVENVDL